MSETPNVPKVPQELIKKHYMAMVGSIMEASYVTGVPVLQLVVRTVKMFGLVASDAQPGKFEMIPELRQKVDETTTAAGTERMQQYFDEDEAVLFCACQTASMEVAGVLDQVTAELQSKLEAAMAKKKAEEGASQEDKTTVPNVVQLTPSKGKPTLH